VERGVLINSKMAQRGELAFTALAIGNVTLHLMKEVLCWTIFSDLIKYWRIL
jgi:hypothetical protein